MAISNSWTGATPGIVDDKGIEPAAERGDPTITAQVIESLPHISIAETDLGRQFSGSRSCKDAVP